MAIYRGPGGPGDATTDATNEATVATNKAAEAAASATAAAASATSAASSATSASTSATNSSTSATSSASSASAASTSATNASNSAISASTAQTAAETAQTAAETAQTAAETAETNASASATSAASSATNAATSETNAANSASAASTSETNAATSETNAAASYDAFDDRYLGAKSDAPTVDNDGDALLTGALYWNTINDQLYVWTGSAWDEAAFSVTGAVTSFNTRTGAVTLSSGDVTTALGFTPQNAASAVSAINDLSDVVITTPSTNQILKYNGTNWVNGSDTDTGILYTDLSVTTAAAGSPALAYNNTNGVFTYTPPDLTPYLTTETNDLTAAVTWANVPDANVPESAVTQHQAALSITESQISNLGTTVLLDSDIGSTVQAYDATIVVDADIGVTVQGYDADTLKADVADTLTAPFRGTVTTDNDLSFDQNVTNNFSCTPSSGATLTFTNHTAGQSGYILLDNSAGVAITAAATTKINATDLTTISTAGVYLVSYFDNGTNAYITVSATYS